MLWSRVVVEVSQHVSLGSQLGKYMYIAKQSKLCGPAPSMSCLPADDHGQLPP